MSGDGGFFADVVPVPVPVPVPAQTPVPSPATPAPHELRVEFLRPPEPRTRWRATVTSFGPWVKVPVTLFLVVRPVLIVTRQLVEGSFPTGPYAAFEVFADGVAFAVGIWLTQAMWAGGKRDGRRIGG